MSAFSSLVLQSAKRLVPGDVIGVVAPSAGLAAFFSHRIEQAQRAFEQLGYRIKFASYARQNRDYVSADPQERAADIHELFSDPEVSALICTIGGNHSNQLLSYLDFDLIKKHPKIFLGYSDITVLHHAFLAKANLRTFYGPCLMTQFGEYPAPLPYTLDYFYRALACTSPIGPVEPSKEWTSELLDWGHKKDLERPRTLLPSAGYEWIREGRATGKLFGGCIVSMNHLAGTEYWMDPAGCLFFLDLPEGHEFGKGLSISDMDAYLADLENLGVFAHISGLMVGRPYNYSTEEEKALRRLIKYYTRTSLYPVVLNMNFGHADPIVTLPFGVTATLDSEKNLFSVEEGGVL